MDLIVLIGSGAVGKMTVGQELMKITNFRLFHNHMMIEPVIEVMGKFDGALVNKLREDVFDAYMKTGYQGMIFTFMWAFDMPSDWEYMSNLAEKFEATGGTVYYVELVADRAVRIERNKSENRLRNKASKRDIILSEDRMLREETRYRLVSNEGELTFENYIRIDNTCLEPAIVAKQIKEYFGLPSKDVSKLLASVHLEEVKESELQLLHAMQVESFKPLYEKYRDDCSPALESLERVRQRFLQMGRTYHFIVKDGARVGAINIGHGTRNGKEVHTISPIFILPKYQNGGIGYVAIQKAFAMHPDAKCWCLDTILQEPGNCHLYEKCGFVRTGEEEAVNEKMTLIAYEKNL